MRFLVFLFLICLNIDLMAQGPYSPAAGLAGTLAVDRDSSSFSGWAIGVDVTRGVMDISNPSLGSASTGMESSAKGFPDGDVVSLGDAGMATVSFNSPVFNGPGFDFAVFENSFSDNFLELAFVEVSTDGERFVRFPSVSLTDYGVQTESFGTTDPTMIDGLAGKYRGGFGTPFDLDLLSDSTGLDLDSIRYVRVVDVVGCVQNSLASFDGSGNIINDPWPTPFESSGFDLDAVGAVYLQGIPLHHQNTRVKTDQIHIFFSHGIFHTSSNNIPLKGDFLLFDALGQLISHQKLNHKVRLSNYPKPGVYLIRLTQYPDYSLKIVIN